MKCLLGLLDQLRLYNMVLYNQLDLLLLVEMALVMVEEGRVADIVADIVADKDNNHNYMTYLLINTFYKFYDIYTLYIPLSYINI